MARNNFRDKAFSDALRNTTFTTAGTITIALNAVYYAFNAEYVRSIKDFDDFCGLRIFIMITNFPLIIFLVGLIPWLLVRIY